MNKYTSALSSVLVAGTMVLTNCANVDVNALAEEQKLTVTPSPLELHGDSVVFTTEAVLPTGKMKEGFKYEMDIQFKPTDGEALALPTIGFEAEEGFDENSTPSFKERFAFKYEDGYERGSVQFKGRVFKVSKPEKVKETEGFVDFPNAQGIGVITTSKKAQPVFIPNYADHGYNNAEEYIPSNMDFFFLQGSSVLRYSEKRGTQGKAMTEYVAAKNPTRTVSITGSHSPEGSTEINSKLANERPEAVEKYYKSLQKKYKYDGSEEETQFVAKPVVENWTMFKQMLQESDKFTDAEKNEILSIVNGSGDFVSKELKLQSLSSYRKLFRYVYPPLRTAKAEVLQIKEKLTDAEISTRAAKISEGQESLDSLSTQELLYAANMTPELEEKEKIYEAVIRKDEDVVAHNNLGATYLAMAKKEKDAAKQKALIEKAMPHFETAAAKMELPEAYANLAGAKLMMGDVEGALVNVEKASGAANPEVAATANAIKGYVEIGKGDYDAAIQYLSSAGNDPVVLYNKALAYLLKSSYEMSDDYTKADAAFKEAIAADQSNAWSYYGAAIVEARAGSEEQFFIHLKNAIDTDKSVVETAVKDLEFAKYFTNARFTDLMK